MVLVSIGNLIKGASGQAIQNMNVMFGLPKTEGVDMAPIFLLDDTLSRNKTWTDPVEHTLSTSAALAYGLMTGREAIFRRIDLSHQE